MYQYNLIISIFSKNEQIKQFIKIDDCLNSTIKEINFYEKMDGKAILNSDIIIWDLEYDTILEVKKFCKKMSKIIICSDIYSEELENEDYVVLKPFNYNLLKNTIKNIIKTIKLEIDLHLTNMCLNTAIDSIPDMIWFKSKDGIHTLVNKKFCEVVGKSKEDIIGKDHYYIWNVSKDDPNSGAEVCKKTEDEVMEKGITLSSGECIKMNEETRKLVTYKSPIYDINNNVIGTFGIGHDITNLKNLSIENKILLNSVPYAVILCDINGKIQNVNSYFEKYFEKNKEEVIGKSYEIWLKETFRKEKVVNNSGFVENTTYSISGEIKRVEFQFNNILDIFGNETGKICILRDVTLERKLEEEIIKRSNLDFMTGLYNRRYLDEFISNQPSEKKLSIISIDLDHFKDVNDTYGHKIGDKALILTSEIMKRNFPNDLIVRMGGDEFVIIKVGNFEISYIKEEIEKLIDDLITNFEKNKEFQKLSASMGIAQGNAIDGNFDYLLQRSDSALYEAKNSGRNCYKVYEEKKLTLNKI